MSHVAHRNMRTLHTALRTENMSEYKYILTGQLSLFSPF